MMKFSAFRPSDPRPFLFGYGTTPPRHTTPPDAVEAAADALATRVADLPLDALVVYDVQDESGRTSVPRPFPYLATLDPCAYGQLLHQKTNLPVVTYKALGDQTSSSWQGWLNRAASEYGVTTLSLVGRATRLHPADPAARTALSLSAAIAAAARHPAGFCVGGVAIAERHRPGSWESDRVVQKIQWGCEFFVSQAVYSPDLTIQFLRDYASACAQAQVAPRRIVLTFTPCGSERTLGFIRWLGIALDSNMAESILGASDPLEASLRLCEAALEKILQDPTCRQLPLGLNIESVSSSQLELAASQELFHRLHAIATTLARE